MVVNGPIEINSNQHRDISNKNKIGTGNMMTMMVIATSSFVL